MSNSSPFAFLHFVERLKETPRAGWIRHGISNPESVSDHMYRMAIMIMMLPDLSNEVRVRAMKMALIHDLGECIVGDITPHDGVSGEEKYLREKLAFDYLCILAKPVSSEFAAEIQELWLEFEQGESEAAAVVRSMDGLECMDQALIYERRIHKPRHMKEFIGLEPKVKHPAVVAWRQLYQQDREEFWGSQSSGMAVIFVIGGPGCGKGTQCAKLAALYRCLHLSVGDLLREEANDANSPFSEFINTSIKHSVIIPADLTLRLVDKKCKEAEGRGSSFLLLDGFPRSMEQIKAFEDKFQQRHSTISLACPEQVLTARLQARSSGSDRADDNQASIVKRLRTWTNDDSQQVIRHLRETTSFHEVDAAASVEEVFQHAKAAVEAILDTQKQQSQAFEPGT